jgi:predicted ATP-grasp superfamily ATP-dependent carboligase
MQDPEQLIVEHSHVDLRSPVLVAAFRGWNDAGDAATFAAQHLGKVWSAKKIASIDPEEFFDFQAVRPQVRLVDGITREIVWPANELWSAQIVDSPHDVLLLVGTEPNTKWKSFSKLVVHLAKKHNVRMLITFGALLADVPHSRPVPITGTAVDADLVKRLGLQRSQYEGPTGIVGVLQSTFSEAGLDSASLWAAVPHYLAVNPNPKAALALVERATSLIGVPADIGELSKAAATYEEQVSELVAADEDVQAYVRLLEQRTDERATEEIDPSKLPSGDALAAELENFLRQRDDGPGSPENTN